MDNNFLTEVSKTSHLSHGFPNPLNDPVRATKGNSSISPIISTPQDALNILKSQPDYEELVSVLVYLDVSSSSSDGFGISIPGPESSQIIHVLVTEIALNYWPLLKEGKPYLQGGGYSKLPLHPHENFTSCLRSLAGLNSLVIRIRTLVHETKLGVKGAPQRADIPANLAIYLDLISAILDGDDVVGDNAVYNLWRKTVTSGAPAETLLHELVNLVTGGKIVSVAAEAEGICRQGGSAKRWWVGDGAAYASWIARNVARLRIHSEEETSLKLCGTLFTRALRLGYSDIVIQVLIENLLLAESVPASCFISILNYISPIDQKNVIFAIVHCLSSKFLSRLSHDDASSPNPQISAVAAIMTMLADGDAARKGNLITWLTSSSGSGVGEGVAIRRAVVAAISRDRDNLVEVVEGVLKQFGDNLYIKHAPMLQQEAHAQVLLLSAGYLNRLAPLKLTMLVRSGHYMTAMSNRVGATATRSRFLGMIIGEALSALMDSEDKKLNFKLDEMETEEAIWYKNLVKVVDDIGPFEDFRLRPTPPTPLRSEATQTPRMAPQSKPAPITKTLPVSTPTKTKPIIEVVDSDDDALPTEEEEDEEEDEDEDLKPYPKPSNLLLPTSTSKPDTEPDPKAANDPSDPTSDLWKMDPSPPAPVYIRHLNLYLRATTDYDKQRLGLGSAADLIRRKARHGTEVSEHAEELASLLSGLHDEFSMDGFEDMRREAMVALVVGRPSEMGPWFARAVWEGDFSGGQRASILVSLGIGARQLAGLEETRVDGDEKAIEGRTMVGNRLPEKLENLYLQDKESLPGQRLKPLPHNAIDTAAQSITSTFLAPMAVTAADAIAGPDALKLTTLTSRHKSSTPNRPRLRAIPNTTANILSKSFFSPLAARLRHALHSVSTSFSSSSAAALSSIAHAQQAHASVPLLQPHLVALYIRTLAVIVHASGPSTLSLPQLTAEAWDLLLAARSLCRGEVAVAGAVLTGIAALLEVNDPAGDGGGLRRLVQEHGREVIETREWVATLFDGLRGDGGGEEGEAKGLAAGVLIRLGDAVEKYKILLVGDMI